MNSSRTYLTADWVDQGLNSRNTQQIGIMALVDYITDDVTLDVKNSAGDTVYTKSYNQYLLGGNYQPVKGLEEYRYAGYVIPHDEDWFNVSNAISGPTVSAGPYLPYVDGTPWSGISIRYVGEVVPPVSGMYTFSTYSDDGSYITFDDVAAVDGSWYPHGPATVAGNTIYLVGGERYDFRCDYFEIGGERVLDVSWLAPGATAYARIPFSAYNTKLSIKRYYETVYGLDDADTYTVTLTQSLSNGTVKRLDTIDVVVEDRTPSVISSVRVETGIRVTPFRDSKLQEDDTILNSNGTIVRAV